MMLYLSLWRAHLQQLSLLGLEQSACGKSNYLPLLGYFVCKKELHFEKCFKSPADKHSALRS